LTGRNQEVWPHAPYVMQSWTLPSGITCVGRKLLVPSCFWSGQYSTLFLPSQEVGGRGVLGELVLTCVLLV
jgi:hypothetical protein